MTLSQIGTFLLLRAKVSNELKNFIFSKKSVLMGVAAMFLFIGGYFEEAKSIPHHVFLEEIIELSGYVLILLVALIYIKKA